MRTNVIAFQMVIVLLCGAGGLAGASLTAIACGRKDRVPSVMVIGEVIGVLVGLVVAWLYWQQGR